jgi:hypothetical protein
LLDPLLFQTVKMNSWNQLKLIIQFVLKWIHFLKLDLFKGWELRQLIASLESEFQFLVFELIVPFLEEISIKYLIYHLMLTVTLDIALFLIFLALYANFNVYTDSSIWTHLLLAVHIKVVLEFPPRDSFKKNVNFESLKGTWDLLSVKLIMHIPNWVKLKLIFFASSKTFPVAPVLPILSLPA